jgi:hypothetical protein
MAGVSCCSRTEPIDSMARARFSVYDSKVSGHKLARIAGSHSSSRKLRTVSFAAFRSKKTGGSTVEPPSQPQWPTYSPAR